MTFKEVLRQVVKWLQEDGRVSNRALKRQFDVGDDYLEDVKEALLYAHAKQITDDGQGLIWSGDPCDPFPDAQPETDKEKVSYV